MEDLIEFLTARLDDEQQAAQASIADRPWGFYSDGHSEATYAFINLFDEERVLADIAAKRAILALHADPAHFCGKGSIERDGYEWWEAGERRLADIPCLNLRLLAQPYAAHEGFQPQWRVEAP